MATDTPVLQIEHLTTEFLTDDVPLKAVKDLSLEIRPGKTMGLVGESGSGKSVTSLSVMRLLPTNSSNISEGKIAFLGKDLLRISEPEMRRVRGKQISMIFQEPGTSLNPVFRVGSQVTEAIMRHEKVSAAEAKKRTIELFKEVGIPDPERRYSSYPHEMSGGQKQRVMIAMALSCTPQLLIADEPTTALDATIQHQILELLRKLQKQRQMSILFITHDLGVIRQIADDVSIMFRGTLVETGPVSEIFSKPKHPYTKSLIACRPHLENRFRRLPTVNDFLKIKKLSDGQFEILEQVFSPEKSKEYEQAGRGRLLHPRGELKLTDHPDVVVNTQRQETSVREGELPLLHVDQLKVYFPIRKGIFRRVVDHVKAVDDVSFKVYQGQTLGLVGESGCGKTTTGRAIVKLLPMTAGHIRFNGLDIKMLNAIQLKKYRSDVQIIFQDPYSSLNPRMTVESALTEAMSIHEIGTTRKDRIARAAELLEEVGLETAHLRRYPHEFSGGQRQRISIARALAVEPQFMICDESVSALDVSVQAQVLNLLKTLQAKRNLTYIFISHDLSVVKFMSDMMAVMHAGKIVEFGPSESIYSNPVNAYTKKLIDSIPQV